MAVPKYGTFMLGLCAGAGIAAKWRPLLRMSVKHGIAETAHLSRSALRYAEDLSDLIHEARFEAGNGASTDARPGPVESGSGAQARLRSVKSVGG